jgi:murein DD-endopeptidase MepM/ murein hydrolase activator NlpD
MGRGRTLVAVLLLVSAAFVRPGGAAQATGGAAAAPATGFVLPVPPPLVVLTPFAPPPDRFGAGHRGVDLAADVGAVVSAAGSGRVVFAGDLAGRGVVSVEHDGGLRTTYEPVTASVAVGSAVTAGQPIGTLQAGHTRCAPASCLHWGARLPGDVYLDPLALLRPWQVRLWPWAGR